MSAHLYAAEQSRSFPCGYVLVVREGISLVLPDSCANLKGQLNSQEGLISPLYRKVCNAKCNSSVMLNMIKCTQGTVKCLIYISVSQLPLLLKQFSFFIIKRKQRSCLESTTLSPCRQIGNRSVWTMYSISVDQRL